MYKSTTIEEGPMFLGPSMSDKLCLHSAIKDWPSLTIGNAFDFDGRKVPETLKVSTAELSLLQTAIFDTDI